ncbi:MAG: CooT family nickel-binding protein [Pseudomonadota bacterium]
MCEAAAYLLKDGQETLVLESVDLVECQRDQVRVVSIFGEEKEVRGTVKSLSLVNHKIIIEAL